MPDDLDGTRFPFEALNVDFRHAVPPVLYAEGKRKSGTDGLIPLHIPLFFSCKNSIYFSFQNVQSF